MRIIPDSEIIGKKWGKLTAVRFAFRRNGKRYFEFKCECGTIKYFSLSDVKNGHIKACGKCRGKHFLSRTRLYSIWSGIKSRCCHPNCNTYCNYGAKGIKMCDEWKNSPESFFKWSFENGYSDNLTIDRIDSDKGYYPENCRWATPKEQISHLKMLKNNKSGYRGVSWSKISKKWVCVISINNKSKRIGAFKTQREAVEARNRFIDENGLIYHQKNVYVGELSNGY